MGDSSKLKLGNAVLVGSPMSSSYALVQLLEEY